MNQPYLDFIQTFLQIPKTDQLDEFTEAAIVNFQLKNELYPSGQPDEETLNQIRRIMESNLDTDISARPAINKKYLSKGQYFDYTGQKKSIFLHHTAGWNNPYAIVDMWNADTRGRIGTAYVVGGQNPVNGDTKFDGEIVECMEPTKTYAWHLGIGDVPMHRDSIGIEVCNFGWVTVDGGVFRTYPITDQRGRVIRKGTVIPPHNVVKLSKPFRGYQHYVKYSDEQIESLKYILTELGKTTGIDITLGLQKRIKNLKDVWKAFDFDPDLAKSNPEGLYNHTNVSGPNKFGNFQKWDMFPQDELIDMIKSL